MLTPWDYWTAYNKKEGRFVKIPEILEKVTALGKQKWPSFTLSYDCLKKVLARPYAQTHYYNLHPQIREVIAELFGTTADKIKWYERVIVRKRGQSVKFK